MHDFVAPKWRETLSDQGLLDFEAWWEKTMPLLTEPNIGRGGWSKVYSLNLTRQDGTGINRLIVKRQLNHTSRTILHPRRGIPTLAKELKNILSYQRVDIPTIEPVYYGQRSDQDGIRAILVTEYLEGFQSLVDLTSYWQGHGWPDRVEQRKIITAVARVVGLLHQHGLMHNCLYPKHLFLRITDSDVEVRLIDLEKGKWRPFGNGRRIRDLETLFRYTREWQRTDVVRFLHQYFLTDRLDQRAKKLCDRIARETRKKETRSRRSS